MSLNNARLFDPNLNNRVVFGTPGPVGPPGPTGPPGPGSSPMTPSVEGTAFGNTDMLGRTQLGYLVDNSSSNNIGLWSSSAGIAQELTNSTSSVTAFVDTTMNGAQMQNGVYLGEMGSIRNSNLSNCLFLERNSNIENQTDWTENTLLCNNFTANPGDSITRSTALITGQFGTDSKLDQSILIGDMTRMDANAFDILCLRTPGSTGTLTMANNTAYIGNGQVSKVMNPNEFMIETFGSYFLKTLRADTTSGNIAYYDPVGGELTYGAPPTVIVPSMLPLLEGKAYGRTTTTGRTYLGYNVDDGDTGIGLYSSIAGAPQGPHSAVNSITALANAPTNAAVLSGSNVIANNSTLNGCTLVDSSAMFHGNFSVASNFTNSVLLGDMTNFRSNGPATGSVVLRPGNNGGIAVRIANNGCLIGKGVAGTVMNDDEFRVSNYTSHYVEGIPLAVGGNPLTYDPVTSQVSYSAPFNVAAKQPTVLGGQYGISSSANGSEVNGINSFNNYSAGPAQLTGVTAVGNNLYQASTPGANSFANSIFLGRTHQFTGAASIKNSLIAANIVGINSISAISESNMVVPRASSLTFGYVGTVSGASFFSSGLVANTTDPLYSAVFSSGGTVNPGQSNLVLSENLAAGTITMAGSGNTLITSSSSAQTYNWPVGISNSTVIRSGPNAVTPTATGQLAVNHTSFLFPNLQTQSVNNASYPAIYDLGAGRISHCISAEMSRVLRRVGTTNAVGQVVFSTGVITPLADSAVSLTVRNTSTTVAYTAQVIAIGPSSVTVQVFNSVTVVLASPSMTPSGAGIIVHMNMSY